MSLGCKAPLIESLIAAPPAHWPHPTSRRQGLDETRAVRFGSRAAPVAAGHLWPEPRCAGGNTEDAVGWEPCSTRHE